MLITDFCHTYFDQICINVLLDRDILLSVFRNYVIVMWHLLQVNDNDDVDN